ncbi:ATP-grasp fold amidoligase family protein [Anaerococcus porci]|uniref:ATP-grasp fold amidoligase family protein n=1 Tax=Anaerococcus porci TaxID=2652269 RepID=UPI002A757C9A|nr:ATP-grasp fold amidoligase family protein [Anaerococcus porci]MDY3006748.1 ATP-grasp fold amidoligase family protein [Anaerococcus porci]
MFIFKIKYYLKRLGIIGAIRQQLFKRGIGEFDSYEYIYNRYYSKLNSDDYKGELRDWYKYITETNKDPLVNPTTFNEKIQWLKLNNNTELKTKCADKLSVRDYIGKKIGSDYLVPLYGVWDKFEDINFSNLPNKMIFKSTTGSGRYKIIKNKNEINYNELKKSMDKWQNLIYGYAGMEIQYLDIDRKIICEKLLNMNGPSVIDYKIHSFNGRPLIIEYISDRKGKFCSESWFDINWNVLKITMDSEKYKNHKIIPKPPKKLNEMLNIASKLSQDFIYVRVDLYEIDEKIYFGELTFTPANGVDNWNEKESQKYVGDLIRLPNETNLSNNQIENIIKKLQYK